MNREEKFYKTFGIEKQQTCSRSDTCYNGSACNDCEGCNAYKYPQITDRILLELLCILNKYTGETKLMKEEYKDIKQEIFGEVLFIYERMRKPYQKELTNQVRKLFEVLK